MHTTKLECGSTSADGAANLASDKTFNLTKDVIPSMEEKACSLKSNPTFHTDQEPEDLEDLLEQVGIVEHRFHFVEDAEVIVRRASITGDMQVSQAQFTCITNAQISYNVPQLVQILNSMEADQQKRLLSRQSQLTFGRGTLDHSVVCKGIAASLVALSQIPKHHFETHMDVMVTIHTTCQELGAENFEKGLKSVLQELASFASPRELSNIDLHFLRRPFDGKIYSFDILGLIGFRIRLLVHSKHGIGLWLKEDELQIILKHCLGNMRQITALKTSSLRDPFSALPTALGIAVMDKMIPNRLLLKRDSSLYRCIALYGQEDRSYHKLDLGPFQINRLSRLFAQEICRLNKTLVFPEELWKLIFTYDLDLPEPIFDLFEIRDCDIHDMFHSIEVNLTLGGDGIVWIEDLEHLDRWDAPTRIQCVILNQGSISSLDFVRRLLIDRFGNGRFPAGSKMYIRCGHLDYGQPQKSSADEPLGPLPTMGLEVSIGSYKLAIGLRFVPLDTVLNGWQPNVFNHRERREIVAYHTKTIRAAVLRSVNTSFGNVYVVRGDFADPSGFIPHLGVNDCIHRQRMLFASPT